MPDGSPERPRIDLNSAGYAELCPETAVSHAEHAALTERVARLESLLLRQRRDVSGLLEAIRMLYPAGVVFSSRDVFEVSRNDTAKGLALRAELVAARIRSPKALGRLLRDRGVTKVDTVREGALWCL